MTLFQVEELASYWTQHPPLHLLLAAYLGIGKANCSRLPSSAQRAQRPRSEVGAILAQLGPGFSGGDVHAGLSPPILDFAELRGLTKVSD